MKTLLILVFGVVAILGQQPTVFEEFSDGNIKFATEVYKELQKTNSGNFLVCPLSVQVAVAFVHAGAKSNTAKQLAAGVKLPDDRGKIKDIFLQLAPYLQINDPYILTSANKLYLANRFKIYDQYKNTAVTTFSADIQNIDFVKNEEAAAEMNKWVEGKTYGKIKELIKADYLNDATVAVIINAMYFKANWADQFDPRLTTERDFFINSNNKAHVDMMTSRGYFNYYSNGELNAQFLELLYEGNDVTMTFVLPRDKGGLSALEARISNIFVRQPYRAEDVFIAIPKFKISTEIDFKLILQAFGVQDAFDDRADFTDMGESQRHLSISEIIQKTFIEVNEKGTTAAASTAIVVEDRISASDKFIADHPFIFFLRHRTSGVFFVGRFTKPEVTAT